MKKVNIKEVINGDKKRGKALFIVLALILLLVLLGSSKKEDYNVEKVKFVSIGKEKEKEQEIQKILEELKRQQNNRLKVNSQNSGKKLPLSNDLKVFKELEEEIKKFEIEKKKKELKIQKLQLEAKFLEAIARIKAAKKKLRNLEGESSSEILVFQAKEDLKEISSEKQTEIVEIGETVSVPAGTFVDAIVQNKVEVNNGETAPIIVFVDHDIPNIYKTGAIYFLRGTKFVGETLAFSERADRLAFAFHTMVLPDGSHVSMLKRGTEIEPMDTKGTKGVASSVNRHFLSLLAKSALIGILEAGTILASPYGGPYYGWGMFSGDSLYGLQFKDKDSENRARLIREYTLRAILSQMTEGTRNVIIRSIRPKTTIKLKAGTRIKLFFPKPFSYKL